VYTQGNRKEVFMASSLDQKFYTVEEVCEKFKVTRKAVYGWMRDGKLEYVQVGSRRRIPEKALQVFIKSGRPEVEEDSEENTCLANKAA
jgi:excisionase family DNA binding protein